MPIKLERMKGIEPSFEAWEAPALPLSYTRIFLPKTQGFFEYKPCVCFYQKPLQSTVCR